MKHRKMLVAAVILAALGCLMWFVFGPIYMFYGVGSYTTGWWIFSETHYYVGPLYWVGLGCILTGIILIVTAIVLIVLAVLLEFVGGENVE